MAGWGGKRVGAGRHYSGAKTETVAKILRKRAAQDPDGKYGDMPLDFLIRVMRSEDQPMGLRVDCAKAAAPFLYSKLASVDVRSEEDRTVRIEFVDFARQAVSNAPAVLAPDPRLIAVSTVLADDATEERDRK